MVFEIKNILSTLTGNVPVGSGFQPSDINLSKYFPESHPKEDEDTGESISIMRLPAPRRLVPIYPLSSTVVAIDSTSFTLGQIPDGVVIAVRISIIIKPPGKNSHRLERYGPYLCPITTQTRGTIYAALFRAIYGRDSGGEIPTIPKVIDRVRNLLERYLQLQVAESFKDSIILMDGSLIGETVANPRFYLEKILSHALGNRNSVVAISKSTGLTLQDSGRTILSLLEGDIGPCATVDIRSSISQERRRYLGSIYVAKLTPLGDPFRIDIADSSPIDHDGILGMVSGLAGDYGYPEELKLAHMTCVLSAIEVMEMQAAATRLYKFEIKEDLRRKLFPI